jgi:hypothetical protein
MSVLLGETATLTATVSNSSDTSVQWSVAGISGGNATLGTISASGVFTAPEFLPVPSAVYVEATSVADPAKVALATVTIISDVAVTIAPLTAVVELGAQQTLQASIVSAGQPSSGVSWKVSGEGCSGVACGTVSPAGLFTAPQILPLSQIVTITATSMADTSRSASAAVTVASRFTFSVSGPSSVNSGAGAEILATLTPLPNSDPASGIAWTISGNGCAGPACGTIAPTASGATAMYTAPGVAPVPNQVTISATPQADPSKAASITVTIVSGNPAIQVTLAPSSATLAVSQRQTFTAQVSNAPSNVTWQVNGIPGGNTAVGQVCVLNSNPCQPLTSPATAADYLAPVAAPSPDPVQLQAVSAEDPSASATAAITILPVTITEQPAILSLSPSSALAGASGGFTLLVTGGNFIASGPGPGSTLVIGGSARSSVCSTTASCTTTLAAQDLAIAGNLSVVVQNPGGGTSAAVSFVVQPAPTGGLRLIPLTPSAPSASGENITVVELSTNGSSSPSSDVSLDVVAVGVYQPLTGTCSLNGGPVTLLRPASGTATYNICAFSVSGLDPSLAYTLSGPSPGDVTISGKAPLGLGIVQLTLLVPSTALPGVRTLFIQNANLDTTAGSGAIVMQ